MVMIPQEDWQSLNDKLDRLAEMIENRNATDRDAEWVESEAARKLLGVSPNTWQNYRDQRIIPHLPNRPQNLRQPLRPRCVPPAPQ